MTDTTAGAGCAESIVESSHGAVKIQSRIAISLVANPNNPCYIQKTTTGETIYMAGSHTRGVNGNCRTTVPRFVFDYKRYIDFHDQHQMNFDRLSTWELI